MNLEDMKGAIILLGLIALIGSAVGIALSDFKADITGDITNLIRVNNETVLVTTVSNTSYLSLAGAGRAVLNCIEVLNITATDGIEALPTTDYTCTKSSGIAVGNASGTVDTQINVSYEYSDGDEVYNITEAGQEGIANSTSYLGTIGTIIGVAVLIGIVVLAFTFVRR